MTIQRQADPASPRPGRPTSADVARAAGVSRATVSHILNGQADRFAPGTVARVREAVTLLGYVPSAAGRALVLGHSDFVILVVPDTTLTNLQDLVEAVAVDLDELGFSVAVHFSGGDQRRSVAGRLQHMVEALLPAAVVDLGALSAAQVTALVGQGVRVLSPENHLERNPPAGNVPIARLQAEHLVARGYRCLAYAFLVDRRGDPYGRVRRAVIDQVGAGHGLPAAATAGVPLEREGAGAALESLLSVQDGPLGVVCANDEVALALVFAAQRAGVSVPRSLGVIGVGASDVGQVVSPRLTTLAFDILAVVQPLRQAVASELRGIGAGPDPLPAEAFRVVQGDTT